MDREHLQVSVATEGEKERGADAAVRAFARLYDVVQTLRSPHGCPWDRWQTPLSMRPNLIEETFEAVDALTRQDGGHVCEELGDMLFNTVMTAYMYEQAEDFSVADALNAVSEKLVRRHPHVFATAEAVDAPSVPARWDAIKETVEGRAKEHVLDEVPPGFPPLLKACKFLKKAAKRGFDWPTTEDAWDKLREELAEVREAAVEEDALHLEEELGDALLALVNLGRVYGVDPELALFRANEKFYRRFCFVEDRMKERQIPCDRAHLQDMAELWRLAKSRAD